jgi:aryl-alcohol dehydrogenase-like predicted oxidoreductase
MYLGTKQDRAASFELLDTYLAYGGNFIDTANIYAHWVGERWKGGESESILGEWLHVRGNRNQVIIASKVGFPYQDVPAGLARDVIRRECEKSLKRLRVDTIDVYFAHNDDPAVPQDLVLSAFAELIAEGKVRTIGASNFVTGRLASANAIARAGGLPEYQVLQQRHSYLRPRDDAAFGPQITLTDDMALHCRKAGLSVMAYSAALGGAYSGEPGRPVPEQYRSPANDARLAALAGVAGETGHAPQQVMFAWLLSKPGMMPLIAASSRAQLEFNLAATAIDLTAGQIARLDAAGK